MRFIKVQLAHSSFVLNLHHFQAKLELFHLLDSLLPGNLLFGLVISCLYLYHSLPNRSQIRIGNTYAFELQIILFGIKYQRVKSRIEYLQSCFNLAPGGAFFLTSSPWSKKSTSSLLLSISTFGLVP